ncbi:MAG TPA: RNA polymerase sigma factor WhiG [Actinomycetota bacterium]|nr:RNA polymerase sigma factor WhiG [Actinomycetota bacterium]
MSRAIPEPELEVDTIEDEVDDRSIPAADVVGDAWDEYKQSGSTTARDQLILHYSPLVKYVAGRVAVGLPSNIDQSDLISYGIFGLIDAIDKYDRSKNVKFETYAISRIRGSIIDELRAIDWVPRSVRFKAREVEKAYGALENRLKRPPSDQEIAAELGISTDELNHIYTQLSNVSLIALDEITTTDGDKGDKLSLLDTLEDTKTASPMEAFENEEMREILISSINHLPEREKRVVTFYYFNGLTLAEIGKVLGVTESRVCQIHTKAVLALKGKIAEATQVE